MRCDRLWRRLIDGLDGWTSARQVAPGRIEVALPDVGTPGRRVQIVMTPDQWDDMASVAFGGFEHAFEYLRDTLESIEGPEDFLVYSSDGTRQDFRPEED